ncbi:MAG: transcriptional regulator EpsA [Nitrosospira sp.]|nr:transcriptional regulator EpsA [Nitrosospira sp.]
MSISSVHSVDHLQRYFRILQEGLAIRRHFDLLIWLQGEMQLYLPHEIMLAAWGDFDSGIVRYDIISALPGVRTAHSEPPGLSPLLAGLYTRWVELGRTPCVSGIDDIRLLHENGAALQCSFGRALQGMRSSALHGISDKRGHDECLYVIFSSQDEFDDSTLGSMEILLPYLDAAFRRVAPLPHPFKSPLCSAYSGRENHGLSERETQIMEWVRKGKTNAEIGSILRISSFTVKNHLHQIFRKLDVYNRMQAVSKIERRPGNG